MSNPLLIAYLFQAGIRFSDSSAVQLHIYHILHGLQQADHTAKLMALQGRQVLYTDDLEALRQNNLRDDQFVELGTTGRSSYRFFESAIRRTQRELRLPYLGLFDSHRMYEAGRCHLQDYAVIHERYNLMAIGGALASRKLGIPYVFEVNADLLEERSFKGVPERRFRRLFALWAMRYCLDTAARVISVSSQLKDHLVDRWDVSAEKIAVLPNAADVNAFGRYYDPEPIRHTFGLTNEPIILFVGGFYEWHDLMLLLKSFDRVLNRIPDARLVLVGDGPTKPMIEQEIRDTGLQRAVVMTGAVDHSRVPEILAAADVAVAPFLPFFSGKGGSPLKLFEYMAAGKAIVATNTGQVAEVIEDGENGILVEPGDVNGFDQAIVSLLTDTSQRRRLGQNAIRQATEQHSWHQYIEQLERIYRSIL